MEVLLLVSEGLRNAEIAQRLVVSPKTVDHHVSSMLAKLGARDRHDAAKKAAELGSQDREIASSDGWVLPMSEGPGIRTFEPRPDAPAGQWRRRNHADPNLPHPGNLKRMAAVLVATAVLVAVLVIALFDVTGSSGSGSGTPAAPAAHSHSVSPSSASSTSCMYLDQPC